MNASKKSGKKSVTAKSQKSVKQTNKPAKAVQSKKSGKSLFERFTGLTLAEFLKLKKLKKTLSGDNGQSGKQISTQQTITFDKMYQDGICKVRKNYYTKMIEFYDLNYVLLDEEERADILGLYSQLINYFDPTINFQIFLFNRHVNEETLAAQFEISPQGDKFDDIREEFSDMLKSLSAKGNNGVIKSKYIIFGIEAENIKEARQRFISLEADIIKNLKNLGTNAKCLDGKERLRVLYEFFNQDKMEPFRFSFKEMAESGNTVKDYIAPQGFEFRFPGRYKMGHMFGATKYLDIISPKLNDELLKRLLDIDSNISISIHMRTIEPTEAIKLLKRALSDVQKTKIDEQKKAVRAGYDMDILPTDIVLYEKNTMELLDDLNTSNQKLIWTTILISSFGRNKKELESVSQRVSGIIQQANCRLIDLQYKQEVAMNAAAPIGINETKEKSRKVNQEFFKRHENEDEKNTEYASQREETRALRKHRQHESRTRVKDSFIQSDGDFHGKTSFVEEAGAETAKSHKLEMLEKKAEKAADKTQKARKKLPQRKEYKLVRHFDEKTGKVTYELQTNKVLKKPKSDNPITAANRRAMMEAQGLVHDKISEDEKDNSGVEAAHRTEEAGEAVIVHARNIKHGVQAKRSNKVAALEKKQFKAEVNFRYQKYLEENPEVKKKAIQKRLQKQRIKREYAKALKKGSEAKQAAGYAKKAATTTTNMARKVEEFARKHIGAIATIGLFGLFFMLIAAGISSCSAVLNGGLSATMAGSYQSQPAQLDASDEAMTSREMALQNTIDSIEEDYPDYDEYNYNLEEIGHNPFTLINYLSAIKVDVVAADVDAEIESLFDEMYELTLTPREETRTRTVTVTNEETGEEEEVEEEYTVTILDVELTRKPLEDIVAERLTGNDDASTLYAAYQQTNGALQQFYTPLDTDWYSLIKSYYGYRKNPITGENQFHRGIDIAVPEGTEVYAGHDGTVTTAAYDDDYGNYIVITDSKGFTTKYAHLESMNVSAGQTVRHGEIIGKTGSTGAVTGSHLHLECLSDGEYYNPLFYFENGNGSIYGTTDPIGGSGDVAALIAEAENYLGYPYVWGGSNPSTSFDCSGFVCYVLTHSGYCNMPRTTAQGIYNQCTPISASEARAGDIIFFTGTYNSGNPVTHVGIYAGNGQMIHAGDPIKYSSINTPYWQSHFYSFARVPGH